MLNLTIAFSIIGEICMSATRKSWVRKAGWLVMPLILTAITLPLSPVKASHSQKATATRTPTATFTHTPTITPTDSLIVFETPSTPTLDPQAIYISSPLENGVLSGNVEILGRTAVAGFSRQEVEFSYAPNIAETWFLLSRSAIPVNDGTLAAWDTSSIADGEYALRLRVFFADGSTRDVVKNVTVRNYSATQTIVPTSVKPVSATATQTAIASITPTPLPTPTSFPGNSAEIPASRIWFTFGRGATIAILLFLIFGVLKLFRNKRT
jgi:hypothetical protein